MYLLSGVLTEKASCHAIRTLISRTPYHGRSFTLLISETIDGNSIDHSPREIQTPPKLRNSNLMDLFVDLYGTLFYGG